jgi:protein-disulfide isomerase
MEVFTLKSFALLVLGLVICGSAARAQDLFNLDGKAYSEKDLTPAQQQQVYESNMQNFEQIKSIVDGIIFDNHVMEESKKQNKSRDEVEAKILNVKEPSERAIKAWYEANKTRIPPSYKFEDVKGEIAKIVKQEEMRKRRDDVIAKIKKDRKFVLNLGKPTAPLIDVKTEGFPAKGQDGAKVTIVEFADYQCPHCKIAAESLKKVTEKFKGKVRLVFMDYPINPSGISRAVAEASHCAMEQGKFWDFHYKAFDAQSTLDKDSPAKLAREIKLDEQKFKACLDAAKGKSMVEKAHSEGERIGVSGTPYLLINGRRYMGAHTPEAITKEIETALK